MDGVHDLGGREGFGPIVDKADDKVIHAEWEIRDFAMKQSSAMGRSWTIDWFRHCRELADPIDYLTRPYYDQWLTTLAAQLIDEGYLSLDEIKRGAPAFAAKPGLPPQTAEAARAIVKRPRSFAVSVNTPPRFAIGATVRCRLDGALRPYAPASICARQGGDHSFSSRRPRARRRGGARRASRRASLYRELRLFGPLAGSEGKRRSRVRRSLGELS